MKKTTLIALHAGYWLLYVFLISFFFIVSQATDDLSFPDQDDWIAVLLFTLLSGAGSFYLFYGWLAPRFLTAGRIKPFLAISLLAAIGIALLSTILVSVATTLIIYLALHEVYWLFFRPNDFFILFTGFALLAGVNGLIGTLLRGAVTWFTDIHLKERAAGQALQTELALLKAQLNPHFLFNTLNNIDVLIEMDAPRASMYLNKLSDYLRFILYETQAEQIPLSKELKSIRQYIALQKIRASNERYVTLGIEGDDDDLLIAPMLFLPYLENAFKFAGNKKMAEAIRIHILVDGERIRFQCTNVMGQPGSTVGEFGGLGQQLLRRRLALLYPEKHTLQIEANDTTYAVDLTLDLKSYALPAC